MLPVVALVGRPNVGKSTLFNVLTRSRDALVADLPGVTRDRHYGVCRSGDRPFVVVDTGGLSGVEEAMDVLTARQVRLAIDEANVLVFVVDAREGLLPQDYIILNELRRSGKPIIAAVNKTDGLEEEAVLAEFSAFGVGQILPLSAAHNRGTSDLIDMVLPMLPVDEESTVEEEGEGGSIRVAIVGRPNAGKSTLINRLLGEDRLIVSDVAGTTRDPIRVPLERDGKRYTLIDTAGIRRKARVEEAVEKFSVIKTLQSIAAAQVVVVMIDARENLADQDLTLIGYAMDEGRALVIAINKWDAVDSYQREQIQRQIETRLPFLKFAALHFISAIKRQGLGPVWQSIAQAHKSATRKMSTPVLTRLLLEAVQFQSPQRAGMFRPKMRYAHQGGMNPPVIVIHGNSLEHVTEAYKRFLEGRIRKEFDLVGTPMRIEFKTSTNPFADKDRK